MSLYSSPSITSQPTSTLIRWSIIESSAGSWHFAGFCLESRLGRFSTEIIRLDLQKSLGTTASGRTYQLQGDSGWDDDAAYVLEQVIHHRKIELRNITNAVLSGEKQLPGVLN